MIKMIPKRKDIGEQLYIKQTIFEMLELDNIKYKKNKVHDILLKEPNRTMIIGFIEDTDIIYLADDCGEDSSWWVDLYHDSEEIDEHTSDNGAKLLTVLKLINELYRCYKKNWNTQSDIYLLLDEYLINKIELDFCLEGNE